MNTNENATEAPRIARLGNGAALHLVDDQGILCNRWGTVNGVWKAPKLVEGAEATCKRCLKLAGEAQLVAGEVALDLPWAPRPFTGIRPEDAGL
jgi:hypothetical protein